MTKKYCMPSEKVSEYDQEIPQSSLWNHEKERQNTNSNKTSGRPLKQSSSLLRQDDLWERSGSVVECLTRDRRAAGSSLTGRHRVVSLSKNINPSVVLGQPRKTRPFITERLLMGRKESNQTNKQDIRKTIKAKQLSLPCQDDLQDSDQPYHQPFQSRVCCAFSSTLRVHGFLQCYKIYSYREY